MSLYTSGQARRSLIDTATYRVLSQAATVVAYVVLVRGMTKQDFGVLNLLYAFIPFVSTAASLGLEQTLRRYQPEYLKAGNSAAAAWLLKFVASVRFGANVVLLGAILLAWNHVGPLFKLAPYRAEFLLLCLLILVHLQARVVELALTSHMLQRYGVGSTAVVAVVKLAAYSALAWNGALALDQALLADIVAFGLAYVFMLRAYRKHCAAEVPQERYRPSPAERRRLLRYGVLNNFNDAGTMFLDRRTDNFFIAAIIDPMAVGIYAFYTRLNEMAQNLLPARLFEPVVQPMFFAIPMETAAQRLPRHFSLLVNLNLALMWPVFAYSLAYHAEIVEGVFSGKFVEYSWMLPVIVLFEMFNVVAIPATLVAQYQEKAGILLLSKVFVIYNVAALLLLLPVVGIWGAAFASGSAQAIKNLFIWWRVRRQARWTNARAALLRGALLWSAVIGVCHILKLGTPGGPLVDLVVGVAIVGLAVLVHVRGPALSADDRATLASVLGGREAMLMRRLGVLRGTQPSDDGR